jgi:hypothetical protein
MVSLQKNFLNACPGYFMGFDKGFQEFISKAKAGCPRSPVFSCPAGFYIV